MGIGSLTAERGRMGMSTDFDRSVEELEQRVIEQARALYSPKVVEEFYNPENLGRLRNPDAYGLVHGWCGDTMEIYLRLDGERIKEATFVTDGCGPTVACGSMLTAMVQGMSLTEAGEVRPKDLLEALDGLPAENAHCADLAVSTLQNALLNWRVEQDGLLDN
jgi:nitrogen fixation NifU-like protein